MTIEIVNVGTELLLGEIVNTNAVYLQKICNEFGFNVYYQSVVGDNPKRLRQCLQTAFERGADCVITTGGLGPTPDDLTKEISAEYLGLPMLFLEEEAEKVGAKCRFLSASDNIPENNYKQAYFPENCRILENEVGTANGCVMEKDGKMIVNLPGPPKEMTFVAEHQLKPFLEAYKRDRIYTCEIVTMGIGESRVAELLGKMIEQQTDVTIALYASEETVRVRLACKAPDASAAEKNMQPVRNAIETKLAAYQIREKDVKQAMARLLPPYHLLCRGDFRFRDGFFPFPPVSPDCPAELTITAGTEKKPLGEILTVCLKTGNRTKEVAVPLLKKAELSYSRLESRVAAALYLFLREEKNGKGNAFDAKL